MFRDFISGKLLQVIDVFWSAAGQFVSLEISKADNRHPGPTHTKCLIG
jgi:hypothetical protein